MSVKESHEILIAEDKIVNNSAKEGGILDSKDWMHRFSTIVNCHKLLVVVISSLLDSSCKNLRNYAISVLAYIRRCFLGYWQDLLIKQINEMKNHEQEHLNFFEKEIKKRDIKPTYFLPLWDLMGVGLGFGSILLGKKAAMLCTASVEEVIDKHYHDQLDKLESDEENLKDKIKSFREDEIHHKNIAYDSGATKEGMYSIMDKIIKTGSKIAIKVSEKF